MPARHHPFRKVFSNGPGSFGTCLCILSICTPASCSSNRVESVCGLPLCPSSGPRVCISVDQPPALTCAGSSSLWSSPSSLSVGAPPATSASAVPEYRSLGLRDLGFEQRQLLALSFPQAPDTCVALCRALQVTELTASERASRAWVAGCWAGAVSRGEVVKPDPFPSFSQPSRFYCILRATGLTAPVVCASLTAYRRVIGIDISKAVSHGFPSTSECRVYFAGAGVTYPAQLTR